MQNDSRGASFVAALLAIISFACAWVGCSSGPTTSANVADAGQLEAQREAGVDDAVAAELAGDAQPDAGPDVEPDAAPKPTVRVLFIGNSYTEVNGLPTVLAKLGEASQSPVSFSVAQHTPPGATWEAHYANVAVEPLVQQGWDYVVLQDQSQQPWFYSGIKPALSALNGKIGNAGAKTVLFMTWARNAPSETPTRFVMDMAVNQYYERHAAAVGAAVAPVGRAWERALRDPTLTLHAADGSHPNERGTYLAACVFYATLTQRSPLGLGAGGLGISAADQSRLQQVAWDTHLARQRSASPAVGAWPLAVGAVAHDMVPTPGLTVGDVTGPGGAPQGGTQFGANKYAGVPYVPGLNTPRVTVAVHAYRSDWSVATTSPEMMIAKPWGYELRQNQQTLEARVFTVGIPPYLTYAVTGLSPGWHHFALTYDGARYALWVDAQEVASATTSGDIRYYPSVPDVRRYDAIAIGAHTVDTALTGASPSALFTGALSGLRVFDQALGQADLEAL